MWQAADGRRSKGMPNQALQQTPPHRLFPGFSAPEAGLLSFIVRRRRGQRD
jgi:hypothetical protein